MLCQPDTIKEVVRTMTDEKLRTTTIIDNTTTSTTTDEVWSTIDKTNETLTTD